MIKNFEKKLIKPASVNIRISNIYSQCSKKILKQQFMGEVKELNLPHIIKPNEYIIAKSVELFTIPKDKCIIHINRSWTIRAGLLIIGGFGDPGYEGEIYFGIKNIGKNNIEIKRNDSLSKIIILDINGKTIPLISRFLGGKII